MLSVPQANVGQFYDVPCVLAPGEFRFGRNGEWIPVLLPAHNDPELDAFSFHYHVDLRFVNPRIFDVEFADAGAELPIYIVPVQGASDVVLRRMKCHRPPFVLSPFVRPIDGEWEKNYAECKIDLQNPVCPHKGFCLKGAPVVDGVILCPGHGLGWDAATGAHVPRYKPD